MPADLSLIDPLVANALAGEVERQQNQVELIASENIVSAAVREALGHEFTNKTLEGYPGNRFHGGAEFADIIEQAAIDRAKELFGCAYVNAQPHSGTQANQAVFFAALKPGDKVLSLDLAAGGHLSHGARPNLSGRWFEAHHYFVERQSGLIDYNRLLEQAMDLQPAMLIAGGSAYPRKIDFQAMAEIACACRALFLVDMAHIAGLVAGGVHPNPVPWADIVTCTTTKTLRGPRGGLILSKNNVWEKKLQSAIFPGVQGSLHTNVIAAKAVCLGEALKPEFAQYAAQVIANAKTLAQILSERGVKLVSGGTDTHLLLLDLSPLKLTGQQAQDGLGRVNITANKNPIPFDAAKPSRWAGLRLGLGAATTRGFKEPEVRKLGNIIADVIHGLAGGDGHRGYTDKWRNEIRDLCDAFPI